MAWYGGMYATVCMCPLRVSDIPARMYRYIVNSLTGFRQLVSKLVRNNTKLCVQDGCQTITTFI